MSPAPQPDRFPGDHHASPISFDPETGLLRIRPAEKPEAEFDYGTSEYPQIRESELSNLLGLEHRLKKLGDAPASKSDIDLVATQTSWEPKLVPLRREADGTITHVVVLSRMFSPEEAAALKGHELGNDASVLKIEPVIDERILGFDVQRPARGRLLCSAPVPYRELGLLIEIQRLSSHSSRESLPVEQLAEQYVAEIPLSRGDQKFLAKLIKAKATIVEEDNITGVDYERRVRLLQERTGLTTKGQLVAYAAEMGLLKPPRRFEAAEIDDLDPALREMAGVAYLSNHEMQRHFGGEMSTIAAQTAKLRAFFDAKNQLELAVVCAAHGLLHRRFAGDVTRHVEQEIQKFSDLVESGGSSSRETDDTTPSEEWPAHPVEVEDDELPPLDVDDIIVG